MLTAMRDGLYKKSNEIKGECLRRKQLEKIHKIWVGMAGKPWEQLCHEFPEATTDEALHPYTGEEA